MKRYLLPAAVFVALLGFLWVGLRLDPREVPSPLVGRPAPAFQLATLHQPQQLIGPQQLAGKVWLLNVWASWCVACRQEHPQLLALAQLGLAPIVGLNYKDQRDAGLQTLQQDGDPYLLSAYDADGRVGIDYGVYGVPETFVIDKRGIIRYKHTGVLTPQDLQQKLVPLLEQLQKENSDG